MHRLLLQPHLAVDLPVPQGSHSHTRMSILRSHATNRAQVVSYLPGTPTLAAVLQSTLVQSSISHLSLVLAARTA